MVFVLWHRKIKANKQKCCFAISEQSKKIRMKTCKSLSCLLISLMPFFCHAQLTMKNDTVTVAANTICTIQTHATNYANIVTGSVTMSWNPTILQWLGCVPNDSVLTNHVFSVDSSITTQGEVRMFWIDTLGQGHTINDSLALLMQTFRAINEGAIIIESAYTANEQKDSLPTQLAQGLVKIPINLFSLNPINVQINCRNEKLFVQWSVLDQENITFFDVQESRTGVVWETIDKSLPHNTRDNNGTFHYLFVTVAPQARRYYRIVAHTTQELLISPIVSQYCNDKTNLFPHIFPNPTTNRLMIATPTSEVVTMQLFDHLGRMVMTKQWQNTHHGDVKTMDIDLPGGNYHAHIICDETTSTQLLTIIKD